MKLITNNTAYECNQTCRSFDWKRDVVPISYHLKQKYTNPYNILPFICL